METGGIVMTLQDGDNARLNSRISSTPQYGSISENQTKDETTSVKMAIPSPERSYIAVAVLCYVNLLNYMDRYTIAGILLNIQQYFRINDSTAGLLQTVFIC
uniref:Major facilitator superfamily (MFS) profile domain-containing protein n=1 Tax=Anguilla anguilla TaxID=7936 RepID=A0A0E9RV41_ANGAN